MKNNHKNRTDVNLEKKDFMIVALIILVALILRLYKINAPLTDHHSWRQVDTAAVARNFVRDGFSLLYPRYSDLSNIQSGLYNPHGYRFVEFPLYNAVFGFLYKNFPLLSLEAYGRLVSVIFSLVIIVVLYYLVFKEEGRLAAIFAAVIFAVLPFFVFFSRVILPDMTALSLMFCSVVFLYMFVGRRRQNQPTGSLLMYLLSLIFAALALLIKPTTIFYFLSLVYLFYKKYGWSLVKKVSFYGYFLLASLPFLLWRNWIQQFKAGIPFAEWLFFQTNTPEGRQTIFFRPAFFRWIFDERILNLILGGYLVIFLILGMIKKPKKSWLFITLGLGNLLYLFTFQGGNVQHDYYQILILPALAIFTGVGITFFLQENKFFLSRGLNMLAILAIFLFSWSYSYYQVKDFYSVNMGQLTIAKIIQAVTEPDDKVVTDTTGDTTLLYLADRKGYPAPTKEFDELAKDGMKYFVTMQKDVADSLKTTYKLIFESDKVYILQLL